MTFTTRSGTIYLVNEKEKTAYPMGDPDHKEPWGSYNPKIDWCPEVARYFGYLVDGKLPSDCYTVQQAGSEWQEVYFYLRSL